MITKNETNTRTLSISREVGLSLIECDPTLISHLSDYNCEGFRDEVAPRALIRDITVLPMITKDKQVQRQLLSKAISIAKLEEPANEKLIKSMTHILSNLIIGENSLKTKPFHVSSDLALTLLKFNPNLIDRIFISGSTSLDDLQEKWTEIFKELQSSSEQSNPFTSEIQHYLSVTKEFSRIGLAYREVFPNNDRNKIR